MKRHSIEYQLADLLLQSENPLPRKHPEISRAILLVLSLYLQTTPADHTSLTSSEIQHLLSQSSLAPSFWAPYDGAALWILLFGANETKWSAQREWFIEQLVAGTRILKLRRWEDVKCRLMQSFYVDRVQGALFREIWEEVKRRVDAYEPVEMGVF
jgi:hypothetical protein